uniref:SJCHGC03004 protein n=1 Tax=Schistosoma japonicum TaxID=6182 RepID=Q5DAK9_SCHJA|nr:SJCHGC03004 protein [Schistosoma japonicum]
MSETIRRIKKGHSHKHPSNKKYCHRDLKKSTPRVFRENLLLSLTLHHLLQPTYDSRVCKRYAFTLDQITVYLQIYLLLWCRIYWLHETETIETHQRALSHLAI